jgi:aspartyl-tRNA(Asn)/glutamyl-tRNA(Gln) amidotransferase subunit A
MQSIREYSASVRKGEIDIVEHTEEVLAECAKLHKKHHFFTTLSKELALQQAQDLADRMKVGNNKGKLFGVPLSVKDCVCVEGVETTSGSKILQGYIPPFSATAVRKAVEEGAIIIGKTVQDEFGFGTFSTNVGSQYAIPTNPHDKKRVCGGSSGGSAGLTAAVSFPHVSIAESTGGSIASPASFCGVAGFTPTYGRVSRYGLIDYASSLDKIGSMGQSIDDSARLLEVMAGHDPLESTSLALPTPSLSGKEKSSTLKIGLVKELFAACDDGVKDAALKSIEKLSRDGAEVEEVSLPLNEKYGIATYYLIAMAEASTNLAKYCGMRYGYEKELKGSFDEYFTSVRSQAFGQEAKRRVLIGTFARMSGFRDAYYLRAMKLRTKLIAEFKSVFKHVDVLAHPTMPVQAPLFEDVKSFSPIESYHMDLCTVPANLGGFPHLSVPVGKKNKLPVGVMLTTDHLQEETLVKAGLVLEGK